MDTFDPKPSLTKFDGKPLKEITPHAFNNGAAFGSPFKFQKYGKSAWMLPAPPKMLVPPSTTAVIAASS